MIGDTTLRKALLWLAGNVWLSERVPRLRVSRRAVRRFMPGEDAASALQAAGRFRAEGIGTLFTRLGENLTRLEEADAVAEHYSSLLDAIEDHGLTGEISVKLTQLGLDLDGERCLVHLSRLCEQAGTHHRTVWIDMEGSDKTEATITLYERLNAQYPNVGLCLQAYLHRTASDVQRLLPIDPQIRLVKGAYAESPEIAYQTRHDIDANYLALTIPLLEAIRAGHAVRLGLGTHDVRLVTLVAAHAEALRLPKTAFEVQMLYGIRVDEQRRLAREGYIVRDLIAYGDAWYAWYLRRLAERPANVLFALRQLLPQGRRA